MDAPRGEKSFLLIHPVVERRGVRAHRHILDVFDQVSVGLPDARPVPVQLLVNLLQRLGRVLRQTASGTPAS